MDAQEPHGGYAYQMTNPRILPEHCLKLIAKEHREPLGKAGRTMAEITAENEVKEEREIQIEIAKYLRLHEIDFIRPAMFKKSTLPPGWPDFTFAYRGEPIGAEAKTSTGKLSADQVARHEAMARNGWRMVIVRGIADVQALLRAIDAEIQPRVKP